jgi:ribonuclease T1
MDQGLASPIGDSLGWGRCRNGGKWLAVFLVWIGFLGILAPQAPARESLPEQATIAVADLPQQARDTMALIRRGGPFPYARDGAVFANREGRLPHAPRGSYREYTVKTPGSRDRGARRIVHSTRDEFYYTADHYRSFRRIVE